MNPSLHARRALVALSLVAGTLGCTADQSEGSAGEPAQPPTADANAEVAVPPADGWIPLFDGKSLNGWTPKFKGEPVGVNLLDTFRVEDGVLRVSYDGYESFDNRFGHLFFEGEYSSYDLRVVYRFVGEQCPGGAGWAFRNNGVMFHGQAPETMGLDQDFPVSVEAQMLGATDPNANRANGGVCTPGTNVHIEGKLVRDHCITSRGPTSAGDDWVEFLVEVRGYGRVRHFVNGELVHEYSQPELDPNDGDAKALLAAGAPKELSRGTISIQAESHGIEFKTIEMRAVEPEREAR